MIKIILFTFISNLFFYSYGNLIKLNYFSNKIENINDRSILGCIYISFIALVANFFIPLSAIFNTFVLVFGLGIFFLLRFKKLRKKEFFYLLISTLIASSLIIYSNINRPDGGLYHLPYISILNEHKIIFGINNVHFRFGATSIIQYFSAINNNIFFKDYGIIIPLASIASFFIIYFFNKVYKIFKSKKNINLENIFCFFVIIFISYKINRYSSFGNDAIAHLSFFYLISKILSNEKISLKFISLISVFTFLNKSTMIITLLIPLIFLIKNFKIKNLKLFYSLASFFLIFWLLKNIIISGCAIYPLKYTCIEKLNWTDISEVNSESMSGEAWSKDWPNRYDKNLSMKEYISNFNWVNTWINNHGIVLIKKIFPYFIFILFLNLILISPKNQNNKKIIIKRNDNLKILTIISILGLIIFLLKFPLFRYGYSYLITSLILIIIYISKEYDLRRFILISKYTFFLCLIIFSGKQIVRYVKNYDSIFIWPKIYSFETNKKINSERISLDKNFNIYISKNVCMYSNSPCTNYGLKGLDLKKKYNYYFLNLK